MNNYPPTNKHVRAQTVLKGNFHVEWVPVGKGGSQESFMFWPGALLTTLELVRKGSWPLPLLTVVPESLMRALKPS